MSIYVIFIGVIAVLSFVRTLGYRRTISGLEKRLDRLEGDALDRDAVHFNEKG